MKPKSRKDILDTCQNNFWSYTNLTKTLIVITITISAALMVSYLFKYIYPTSCGIINGEIVGLDIIWKIVLAFMLYIGMSIINIILVAISGASVCKEENWNIDDFAEAWMNMYKYKDNDDK